MLWVGFGTYNIRSQSGKEGKVCEDLRKRMNDVCCLKEVRCKGHGSKTLRMQK